MTSMAISATVLFRIVRLSTLTMAASIHPDHAVILEECFRHASTTPPLKTTSVAVNQDHGFARPFVNVADLDPLGLEELLSRPPCRMVQQNSHRDHTDTKHVKPMRHRIHPRERSNG